MPLYEYQCDACSNRFERIQRFSDPPVDVCPACGGAVRKLLSSPAIQFKGSGWYITDYAKKSSSKSDDGKNSKGAASGDGASSGSASTNSSPAPASSSDSSGSGTKPTTSES